MGAPAARPFLGRRGRGAKPLWEPRKQGLEGPEDVAPGAWTGHHVESRGWGKGLPPLVGTNTPARLRGQKCGDSIDVMKCHATYTKHTRCTYSVVTPAVAPGLVTVLHQGRLPVSTSVLFQVRCHRGEKLGELSVLLFASSM